jgi:THO complex subunit 5
MADADLVSGPLERYKSVSELIRKALTDALELKKKGADAAKIKEATTRISLLFLELKSANRSTFLATETTKQSVQDKKKEMAAHHLRLQNLLYEKNYLLREIKRCKDFTTTEMDKINLVPDSEIDLGSAPDEYHKQLVRLEHELAERKRLKSQLHDLKAEIKTTENETAEKTHFLNGLPDQLKAIEKSTEPLQTYIALPVSEQMRRHANAQSLPSTLYVLYCQLDSYAQNSDGDVVVEITTSNAPDMKKIREASTAEADEAPEAPSRKRRRGDEDDGEETPSSRAKRSKSSSSSAAPSNSGSSLVLSTSTGSSLTAEASQKFSNRLTDEQLYQPAADALKVTLKTAVGSAGEPLSLCLRFQYLPNLDVVTCETEGTDAGAFSLDDLFPCDSGVALPTSSAVGNLRAFHRLPTSGFEALSPALPGRAYEWAQSLSGKYALPSQQLTDPAADAATAVGKKACKKSSAPKKSTDSVGAAGTALPQLQASVQQVVQQVQRRMLMQHQLQLQLRTLESAPKEIPLPDSVAPLFASSPSLRTSLTSWTELSATTAPSASSIAVNFSGIDSPFRTDDGGPGGSQTKGSSSASCRYFKAMFKRSTDKANLPVCVQLSPDYPATPPRFLLQSRTPTSDAPYDNTLKVRSCIITRHCVRLQFAHLCCLASQSIEVEVNAFYYELLEPGNEGHLLSLQLRRVQMCFDLLGDSSSGAAPSLVGGRKHRGRDRRRRITLDPSSKALVHR